MYGRTDEQTGRPFNGDARTHLNRETIAWDDDDNDVQTRKVVTRCLPACHPFIHSTLIPTPPLPNAGQKKALTLWTMIIVDHRDDCCFVHTLTRHYNGTTTLHVRLPRVFFSHSHTCLILFFEKRAFDDNIVCTICNSPPSCIELSLAHFIACWCFCLPLFFFLSFFFYCVRQMSLFLTTDYFGVLILDECSMTHLANSFLILFVAMPIFRSVNPSFF